MLVKELKTSSGVELKRTPPSGTQSMAPSKLILRMGSEYMAVLKASTSGINETPEFIANCPSAVFSSKKSERVDFGRQRTPPF